MRWWGRRVVVVAALVLVASMPVRAAFHQAVIDEVMSGCGADGTVQFVEIRMLANDQDMVGGSRLRAFSCDGTPKALLSVQTDIGNSMMDGRWLMASANFQAAAGIAPDFVISNLDPGIFPNCGLICWGKPGVNVDDPSAYVDCVAYGPYVGPPAPLSTPVASTPNTGAQSLTRAGGVASDNNFVLAAPSPTNSMNEVGDLSACTPVTSTTTTTGVGGGSTTSTTTGGGASTTTTTSGGGSSTSTTLGGPALLGGGAAKTDCLAEWRVQGAAGTAPVVRCTDNDTACDRSPVAGCIVRAQLCFNDAAASLYGGKCTATPITAFALAGTPDAQNAAAVGAALQQLPGAQPAAGGVSFAPPLAALTCTGPIDLEVPLKVKGTKPKKGSRLLKSVTTADKRDKDKLKILCVP